MKKDKSVQNRSILDRAFPHCCPRGENGGETESNEQPTIDEIWEWLGDKDKY